jgi:NADH-quinone oxidoreductase subunit F
MNKFETLQKNAKEAWSELENSSVPIIYIGTASCGRAAGALDVLESIEETLQEHHIEAKIIEVGCIGPCYLEPLMDIKKPGMPRISYSNVSPKRARNIVESLLLRDDPKPKMALGYFDEDGVEIPQGIERFWDHPMLKRQVRVVLRNCGFIDPGNIDHYLAHDGYVGLMNALEMKPEGVLEQLKISGLRGRGGAGFPTYRKWEFCRNAEGSPKYMICNADEGDPGAFMNRSLFEGDPHAILEGLTIAAYTIGANYGYIYIRAEYPLAIERLKAALKQMKEYGLTGKNIMGSGFDFEIKIKEGAGAFVCGEETALMSSIEGKRGMPRTRPPYPAISGLFKKPTTINNAETLGTVPNILRNGGKWYQQFGVDGNYGTKTFSLVGKVQRTGLIEAPLGTTLREIIFDIGGGTKKPFKAVQTGGPSGGCLPASVFDTQVNYEALTAAGSIMGSGGLIVMDEDTCVVDIAHYFLNFVQKESCGKCTPCRIGTRHLFETLDRITKGQGKKSDIENLKKLAEVVKNSSLCGLGQTAPNPVLTTLRYFEDEYMAHVVEKRCPASICKELFEFVIIPENCTGCQRCIKVCPTDAITGELKKVHVLDTSKCIKCRACYEVCNFDAIKGQPITVQTVESVQ